MARYLRPPRTVTTYSHPEDADTRDLGAPSADLGAAPIRLRVSDGRGLLTLHHKLPLGALHSSPVPRSDEGAPVERVRALLLVSDHVKTAFSGRRRLASAIHRLRAMLQHRAGENETSLRCSSDRLMHRVDSGAATRRCIARCVGPK